GLGGLRVLGLRSAQAEALRQLSGQQQKVFVMWALPAAGGSDGSGQVLLPGTLIGGRDTAVYARSSGYVRRWLRDIGAHVHRGELIAEIETPELEQQVAQSRATLRQATVNLDLARQTLARWQTLRKDDLVTQQDVDERASSVEQLAAAQSAARADLARQEALAGFEHVEAPFDGVITRRNVEIGSLVNSGNGGSAQALFQLDSTDRLRLEIYVPQAYAPRVKVGMPVDITQAERPGQHFAGTVARTAGAIDSATRTLQVEVEVPNRDGRLLPGSYVQAGLGLRGGMALTVPANALLFRAEGPRLAVVDEQGRIRLAQVALGRDLGKTIEIAIGLQAQDHVVLNPPDALAEGDLVDARPAPPPKTSDDKPAARTAAGADKATADKSK
ncbi:MAG: efflux RND transporter periplasmic adaptor subunit, partial [Pseudomonadota bacterium]|nr:efflux RND transporter periplasmic adaptor subunit [Pseudomonadota bacterium]